MTVWRLPIQALVILSWLVTSVPAWGDCPPGEHDGGDGSCVPEGQCISGFENHSATGRCFGWVEVEAMNFPRVEHTATLLHDGRVLVAGGITRFGVFEPDDDIDIIGQAEVFDPEVGRWETTGDLFEPRYGHSASVLEDGFVAIFGGRQWVDDPIGLNHFELYDPEMNEWVDEGLLAGEVPFFNFSAAPLNDGILVTGGNPAFLTCSEEICELERRGVSSVAVSWYPSSGDHTLHPPMYSERALSRSITLRDGRVLVIGGWVDFGADFLEAELFDPLYDMWLPSTMMQVRASFGVALLDDGRVLVAGGEHFVNGRVELFDTVEIFDPEYDYWEIGDSLPEPRSHLTATPIGDSLVLVVGGQTTNRPEEGLGYTEGTLIFDTEQVSWTEGPLLPVPLARHTATALYDGRVLVTGGVADDTSNGNDQVNDAWSECKANQLSWLLVMGE